MKVLSIKQPYVELILLGKKTIELRKWNTKHRGEFLIHSSKIPDEEAMKKFGFKELPCGFILGKVSLIDIKKYKNKQEHDADKDKHLASDIWGNFGFVLENPQRINPIKALGKLGFWNYEK